MRLPAGATARTPPAAATGSGRRGRSGFQLPMIEDPPAFPFGARQAAVIDDFHRDPDHDPAADFLPDLFQQFGIALG